MPTKTVRKGLIGLEDLYTGPNPTFSRSKSDGSSQTLTAVTLSASTEDGIQYVNSGGNDSSSGLTWNLAKLTASSAHTALPAGGGVIYVGAGLTFSSDPFTGMTKNTHVIFMPGTHTFTIDCTFPVNVSVELKGGAILTAGSGIDLIFNGPFQAPRMQVFSGAGTFSFAGTGSVVFNAANQPRVTPIWWGMQGYGSGTDATTAINAACASLTRGGIVEIDGYVISDAPTLANVQFWTAFEVTGRWDWNTQLSCPSNGRLIFIGKGGGATQLRQSLCLANINMGTGFTSGTVPLLKITNAGLIGAKNIAFTHNKAAPVFQSINGAATNFDNVNLTNNNSGVAHVVELDGCFQQYFNQVTTNTSGAAGSYNYHITATTASTQDPGITKISNCQMNNSGILIDMGAGRGLTGAFTTIKVEDCVMEGGSTGVITIDLTNNPTINHIVLDGVVNADSVAFADAIEIKGTPTSQNAKIRDVFIRNMFFARPVLETASCYIQNLVVEGSHPFTGAVNLSTQRDWTLQIGAQDSRWLYSGGRASPSWLPFAAANASPAQDSTTWNGYTSYAGSPTVTGSILDPFGGTGAFRISSASGAAGKSVDFDLATAVGDWVVFGSWVRSNSTTQSPRDDAVQLVSPDNDFTMDCGNGFNQTSTSIALHALELRRFGTSTGWFPAIGILKVATVPTSPATYSFRMACDNTKPTDFYHPFLILIPASLSVPDGEVIRAWRAGAFNNINLNALANEVSCVDDTQTYRLPIVKQAGKTTLYNNIATVKNGVPSELATVDLTAQGAAIGTTTLYAVPAAGVGQYRLVWNAKVTTAATTGAATSTLGALTIVYTDPDSVVQTITAPATIAAGTIATTSTGNSTTTVLIGLPLTLNCKASTNITYAMAYASDTAGQMKYNLNIRLEAM